MRHDLSYTSVLKCVLLLTNFSLETWGTRWQPSWRMLFPDWSASHLMTSLKLNHQMWHFQVLSLKRLTKEHKLCPSNLPLKTHRQEINIDPSGHWLIEAHFYDTLISINLNVSFCSNRLIKYCMEHQTTDVPVTGITQSENPFKENKACTLLWRLNLKQKEFKAKILFYGHSPSLMYSVSNTNTRVFHFVNLQCKNRN